MYSLDDKVFILRDTFIDQKQILCEVAKAKKQAKDDKAVDDEQHQSDQVLRKEKEMQLAKSKETSVADESSSTDESAEDNFFAEFSHHVRPEERKSSINWEGKRSIQLLLRLFLFF